MSDVEIEKIAMALEASFNLPLANRLRDALSSMRAENAALRKSKRGMGEALQRRNSLLARIARYGWGNLPRKLEAEVVAYRTQYLKLKAVVNDLGTEGGRAMFASMNDWPLPEEKIALEGKIAETEDKLATADDKIARAEAEAEKWRGDFNLAHRMVTAALEETTILGQYVHLEVCNGDRTKPPGESVCSCPVGRARKERNKLAREIVAGAQAAGIVAPDANVALTGPEVLMLLADLVLLARRLAP